MDKPMITLQSTVAQTEGIIAADLEGEKVMLLIEKGKYFGMDVIGSRIWELIEQPCRVEELIDALLLEYAVAAEDCRNDVMAYLEELRSEGLISVTQ